MRLVKCYFCSSTVYPGHGMMFVRNDCKEFRFCRAKCHKAFKHKRNPRKVRWTKAFRKSAGKEMAIDSVFDFEKRRHVPVKYDRELVSNTVKAMKRIQEIRQKRERAFIKKRLDAGKVKRVEAKKKLVEKSIGLIVSPVAKNRSQLVKAVMDKSNRMDAEADN